MARVQDISSQASTRWDEIKDNLIGDRAKPERRIRFLSSYFFLHFRLAIAISYWLCPPLFFLLRGFKQVSGQNQKASVMKDTDRFQQGGEEFVKMRMIQPLSAIGQTSLFTLISLSVNFH